MKNKCKKTERVRLGGFDEMTVKEFTEKLLNEYGEDAVITSVFEWDEYGTLHDYFGVYK